MKPGQKLTRAAAREAHRAYLADPLQTLDTLAPPLGVSASGLHRAWQRLGLSCCPAADRGGNVAAQERAKARRAEREAAAEVFRADPAAAGWPISGLPADVAREAIATLDASGDPAAAALRARLDVLTGGGARATVAGMSSPTLDAFAAAFYQAMIHNHDPEKAPRWEALTPAEQATRREQAKSALLYIGAPYEASPGSPPPIEPAP